MSIVTIKEAAEFLGMTTSGIRTWFSDENWDESIEVQGDTRIRRLESRKLVDWYIKYKALKNTFGVERTLRVSGDIADTLNYTEEKARLTKAQADHEELKIMEKQKATIPTELVITEVVASVNMAKSKILAINSKIRGRHPEIDPEVFEDIDFYVREALEEIGDNERELPNGLIKHLEEYLQRMETATKTND